VDLAEPTVVDREHHDGRQGKARDLINSASSQQDDLRNQHPAFAGKTIEAVYLSGSGAAAALSESNITDYLQGLGFSDSQDLQRVPGDARPLRPIKSDNLCLINIDALSSSTGGAMGIVDDPPPPWPIPAAILGTEYLNSAFVDVLARQIN
jgi:hypothetical protein